MTIAIAAIRKAAQALEQTRDGVSRHALALFLSVSVNELNPYLIGIDGLAEEIGISNEFQGRNEVYYCAAKTICAEGKIPTYSLLAERTGKLYSAVYMFCKNNPDFVERFGVTNTGAQSRKKVFASLREAVYGDRPPGTVITIGDLAKKHGVSKNYFLRSCRKESHEVEKLLRELNVRNVREKYRKLPQT